MTDNISADELIASSVNDITPEIVGPLTEAAFFVLTSLQRGSKHGYAVMQEVSGLSRGRVELSRSTLYENLGRLSRQRLIKWQKSTSEDKERRKIYEITESGRKLLFREYKRLVSMKEVAGQAFLYINETIDREESLIWVSIIGSSVLLRERIRELLLAQPDIGICKEAEATEDIAQSDEALKPDVLLLQVDLPLIHNLELVRRSTRHLPGIGVIVLAPYEQDDFILESIKAGASAYVSQNVKPDDLVSTIRRVAHGEFPINEILLSKPMVAERVLRQFQDMSATMKGLDTLTAPFSKRELEILNYIAEGHTNRQIAAEIKVSEQTVKNHVTSVLRKLNANDRAHAVVLALRRGWISIESSPK